MGCPQNDPQPGDGQEVEDLLVELVRQAEEFGLYDLEIPPCACGRAQPCRHCADQVDV